ncbi:MAG: HAMP domain-containing protein [Proteobacteria bacterium]|nr:HAMP domain-containing protein [Pseudomonadota bacterium]MBU1737013.1 HAMP domain-containing protein [Pseudomonadota bacterium]
MTIRKEITCMMLAILALYAVLNYFVMGIVIDPAFQKLERQEALKDMERFIGAMESEIHHLDILNHDWAAWDDTYEFIRDRNHDYVKSNLVEETFFDNKVNLVFLLDSQGRVVWGKAYDLETGLPLEIKEFPADIFPDHHPLLGLKETGGYHAGVYISSAGPMFVSARPIITSKLEGPVRGTIIMGKVISAGYLESLARRTQTNVQLWVEGDGQYSSGDLNLFDKLNGSRVLVADGGEDTLNIYSLFADLTGEQNLMIFLSSARHISTVGKKTGLFVNLSILAVGVLVMAFFLLFLGIRIVTPLRKLSGVIVDLGKNDELYSEINVGGCDEILTLGREFNDMVSKLNLARYRMINQSYFSGMADVTSDLIHNIRNTLTPIVTDVVLLREKCSCLPLESMRKSIEELISDRSLDSARREKLAEFLVQALGHIEKIRDDVDLRLDKMEKDSDITRKFLEGIEDFSRQGFYIEKFNLDEVTRDVSDFFRNKFPEINFTTSLENVGVIKSHKSALIQILVNLLQNAGEAVRDASSGQGKVEFFCKRLTSDERDSVLLSVKDNGRGIAAENMDHLFERGFSTKNKKVSGIGLHWCANTIKSLGGSLSAESDGVGCGASFHVRIPLEPEF